MLKLLFILTIPVYSQDKYFFSIHTGVVNSKVLYNSLENKISYPNINSLKLGIQFDVKIKHTLFVFAMADVYRHKDKLRINYQSNFSTSPTITTRYGQSNIYLTSIGIKYNLFEKRKYTISISAGPQLFLQKKLGELTSSTDSLVTIKDSITSVFITNWNIEAINKVNVGYRFNLDLKKNIKKNHYFIFGISFQNSFNTIRKSEANSTKNGSFYDKAEASYTGRAFMFNFGYGFMF